MILNTDTPNNSNIANIPNIDDTNITINNTECISNLDIIPRSKTDAYLNKQYHKSLRDELSNITSAIHALDMSQVQQLRTQSNDPLLASRQLYANIINVFPVDEYGLTIFKPITSYKSRPNKSDRIQSKYPSYPSIPPKPLTKAQQKKQAEVRDKREAQKLKHPPSATLTFKEFEEKEKERQTLLQKRRQKALAKQQKEMRAIPQYLIDDNNDNNTACIDNNHNTKRRSSRKVKPSQVAIESRQYVQREKQKQTLKDEAIGTSDEDEDDDLFTI